MRLGKLLPVFISLFLICLLFAFCSSLSNNLSQSQIYKLVQKHHDILLVDIQSGNFENALQLKSLRSVNRRGKEIDFYCGGSGFASATNYYGFKCDVDDDASFFEMENDVFLPLHGQGYWWHEDDGDNSYYTQEICKHFYYYEAHY